MNVSTITAIISAVIAICALASPIITAEINNSFDLKKQKQDLDYKSKQAHQNEMINQYSKQVNIISDFVYSINAAAITLNENDKKSVAKAGAKLIVLLNPTDQKIVINAIKVVNNSNAGFSSNDVDQIKELADKITRNAPIWLEQANKNKLR